VNVVKRRAWLSVAIAAVLISTTVAQPGRFTLAIVRLDGRLVPFAAYEGGRWERAWPEAGEATGGTPTIDTTPSVWRRRGDRVPHVWQVWPSSGGTRTEAHVQGVEIVEAHCQRQVALATDLPEAKGEHPLKFGVAVDSNLPIGSIEEVRRSDVVWRTAERAVVANFSGLEAAKAQADRGQLLSETPAPVARITALYREAKSPRSPMYFVADRKYRTARSPQDPGCTALTIMTGWLVPTDGGALTLRDPKVFLTDCDAKEVRTALPLAVLRVSGQLFWVLQEHGYEDETYVIAEIGLSETRYPIDVSGGGC
jgi:hypothetical protein